MKILHTVEYYYPSLGGAQEAVKQLSERMAEMGHQVTVATSYLPDRKSGTVNGVKIKEFRISGNEVVGISGDIKEYQNFLRTGDFDIMMNYAAQQWATDAVFDVLDVLPYKKVLVPCGYSALYNDDFKHYFERMPNILNKYDASIYFSRHYQDYEFAKRNKIRNCHIIPNGANEKEFADDNFDEDPIRKKYSPSNFLIVSISNHTGAKGHKEMIEVFEALPFSVDLIIIGGKGACEGECLKKSTEINSRESGNKSLTILDTDRKTTLDILRSADLFLFLSNTEASPLVLFEAGAAGVPFISTDVGNAKEIANWTGGGYITKTLKDKVNPAIKHADIDKCVKLLTRLKNKTDLKKIGAGSKEVCLKKFTWDNIARDYIDLYKEIIK